MSESPDFRPHTSQATRLYAPTTQADVQDALAFISPDICHDEWVQVGMALQHEFGDAGFDLWDTWSSNGQTYQAMDTKSAWRSFNPNGTGFTITIATLFRKAKEGGYKPANNALNIRISALSYGGLHFVMFALAVRLEGIQDLVTFRAIAICIFIVRQILVVLFPVFDFMEYSAA